MRFLQIFIMFFFVAQNLFAQDEVVDFANNVELLSNNFDEFKGVRLEVKDNLVINNECIELANKKPDLHKKCQKFYRNLALTFKVDAALCTRKAQRMAGIKKEQALVLIDEDGKVRNYVVKNAPFAVDEEYERCMDKAGWKDSQNFRYGKF